MCIWEKIVLLRATVICVQLTLSSFKIFCHVTQKAVGYWDALHNYGCGWKSYSENIMQSFLVTADMFLGSMVFLFACCINFDMLKSFLLSNMNPPISHNTISADYMAMQWVRPSAEKKALNLFILSNCDPSTRRVDSNLTRKVMVKQDVLWLDVHIVLSTIQQ